MKTAENITEKSRQEFKQEIIDAFDGDRTLTVHQFGKRIGITQWSLARHVAAISGIVEVTALHGPNGDQVVDNRIHLTLKEESS